MWHSLTISHQEDYNPKRRIKATKLQYPQVRVASGKERSATGGRATKRLKTLAYLISGILGFFGVAFLIAGVSYVRVQWIIIGPVLLLVAFFVTYLARTKVPDQRIIQEIDLSGDVHPEEMKCNACGAPLDKDSVSGRAGGIFVDCPYCGTSYQIEEEPKW